jgi:hypothetical protein
MIAAELAELHAPPRSRRKRSRLAKAVRDGKLKV